MTITEVYEKYKHLDDLLSNLLWLTNDLPGRNFFDLWQKPLNRPPL